ncbi:MAG: ATPase domain-containing protein [Candidatus Aenigmatarchaeota archaeon]|jgi:circadian clock protein KaiC
MKQVSTGIKGLDTLLKGGLPKGSTTLISGTPGSGKTILSMQFLVNGYLQAKEKGLYISLEEDVERMEEYMSSAFNWPIKELRKKNKVILIHSDIYDFEKFKDLIETTVEKNGIERVVIDPITVISLFFERPLEIRRSLLELDRLLKKLKCTSLLTCEIPEGSNVISSFGIEEFTSDGIIILYYKIGSPRGIVVRKMRLIDHDKEVHPFEIKNKKGIIVYPTEKLF